MVSRVFAVVVGCLVLVTASFWQGLVAVNHVARSPEALSPYHHVATTASLSRQSSLLTHQRGGRRGRRGRHHRLRSDQRRQSSRDNNLEWESTTYPDALRPSSNDNNDTTATALTQLSTDAWERLVSELARPYEPFRGLPNAWCVPSRENDAARTTTPFPFEEELGGPDATGGLVLAKTFKTGSSMAASLTLHIAHAVGARQFRTTPTSTSRQAPSPSCRVWVEHEASTQQPRAMATLHSSQNNDSSSNWFVWTIVRQPDRRAVSSYAYYKAGWFQEHVQEHALLRFLEGQKNHQLVQLRTHRRPFRLGFRPTCQRLPDVAAYHAEIVRHEIQTTYDFVAVAERWEESVVVLRHLLGLPSLADVVVAPTVKSRGSWTHRYEEKTCFRIPPINRTTRVQQFLTHDFREGNGDFLLYTVANRSLDLTINSLGRALIHQEVQDLRWLQQHVRDKCHDQIVFPCSSNGTWQPNSVDSCYRKDFGCGHACIAREMAVHNDHLNEY